MVLACVVNQRLERLVVSMAQLTGPTVQPVCLLVLSKMTTVCCLETALQAVKQHSSVMTTVGVQVTCNRPLIH